MSAMAEELARLLRASFHQGHTASTAARERLKAFFADDLDVHVERAIDEESPLDTLLFGYDLSTAEVLLAQSDERCAALVFDGVGQITGLGLRVLWQLRLEAGRVVAFHETITSVGNSLEAVDDELRAAAGLQKPSEDAVSWAEDRVLESLGTTLSPAELSRHYRRESVLEHRHRDYYLLPISYSGCWGFIVEKTGRVHQLAPLPIAVLLWAFDEGIDTHPRRRDRRRYDLRLEAIRDRDTATRILAEFVDQPTLEALLVPTPQLPIVLRNVDLYPALELLCEARVGEAVTFSVDPAASTFPQQAE